MLEPFDWIRLARTGAELFATMEYLAAHPGLAEETPELAAPLSALQAPCRRCAMYPRMNPRAWHCTVCEAIYYRSRSYPALSESSTLVWAYVNQLPRRLRSGPGYSNELVFSSYVHDTEHFLLVLRHGQLKPWLQELMLYNGTALKGLLQIFPSTGAALPTMAELLIRVKMHEGRFPLDRLRVRFLAAPHYIFHLRKYDREGVLTFDVGDFISTLEMASVFRSVLLPDEQAMLRELLRLDDDPRVQFYWGRLLSMLNQEAKDMLNAWRIRNWTEAQVDLLYRLSEYVAYY